MYRVRCKRQALFAFGAAEWGVGDPVRMPLLPGSVVSADRIERQSPGAAFDFYVSSPAYVEDPTGNLSIYSLEVGVVREQVSVDREAWDAWLGGVGVTELRPVT
jgi:hypothetical protein